MLLTLIIASFYPLFLGSVRPRHLHAIVDVAVDNDAAAFDEIASSRVLISSPHAHAFEPIEP